MNRGARSSARCSFAARRWPKSSRQRALFFWPFCPPQAINRELRSQAPRAEMVHTSDEARIQEVRTQQPQECGLGVGARDHRTRRDAAAGFEHHTRGAVLLDHDARGGSRHPDIGAGCRRRPRQRFAQGAHPALGLGESRAGRCLRRQSIQQRENRARRARAEIRAEHRVGRQRALQHGGGEVLLEQVMHVHAADAQQFAHVAPAELADTPARTEQRQPVFPALRAQPGRHGRQNRG